MYCVNCGKRLGSADRFCGNCGEGVRTVAPPVSTPLRNEQTRNGSLVKTFVICIFCAVLVASLAVGAIVFQGTLPFPGNGDPPDSAFGKLLPTLESRTDAPIMLPSDLPPKMNNVAVDSGLEGDSYGIVFKVGEPKGVLDSYVRVDTLGTLTAVPISQVEPDEFNNVTSSDSIRLDDDTEAFLRYKEPFVKGSASAFWEGYFEKDGYTYTLSVYWAKGGDEMARQALSSMVSVPVDVER